MANFTLETCQHHFSILLKTTSSFESKNNFFSLLLASLFRALLLAHRAFLLDPPRTFSTGCEPFFASDIVFRPSARDFHLARHLQLST